MTYIFVAFIERRNFGSLLSPDSSINVKRIQLEGYAIPNPGGSLLAIWGTDPAISGGLPEVLICGDREREDWVAWITTYAKGLRPISSFCRVLEWSEAKGLLDKTEVLEAGRLSWAFSGLILGEVLAASNLADSQLESLPTAALTSTLSFAVLRSYLVFGYEHVEAVEGAWSSVRAIAGQKERSVPAEVTARVCRIVLEAAGAETLNDRRVRDDLAIECCRALIRDLKNVPKSFYALPGFSGAYSAMEGAREARVIGFARFLDAVTQLAKPNDMLANMAIGYLASRIAPGTILHSSLLESVSKVQADVLLWYGFFAGLPASREGELFQAKARLGVDMPLAARRVLRELQRSPRILSRPSADVSLFELVALGRAGKSAIDSLPRYTNSVLLVELLPGVDVATGLSHRQSAEVRSREIPPGTLRDLSVAIDTLRDIHRQLAGVTSPRVEQAPARTQVEPKKALKRSPPRKKKV
ncbi:MAG: hypothetical protein JNJ62_09440 [Pseudoxanthomonas mexicana]|nr:hypothetical protein [Pseudoxanthomonas mexicana]